MSSTIKMDILDAVAATQYYNLPATGKMVYDVLCPLVAEFRRLQAEVAELRQQLAEMRGETT